MLRVGNRVNVMLEKKAGFLSGAGRSDARTFLTLSIISHRMSNNSLISALVIALVLWPAQSLLKESDCAARTLASRFQHSSFTVTVTESIIVKSVAERDAGQTVLWLTLTLGCTVPTDSDFS